MAYNWSSILNTFHQKTTSDNPNGGIQFVSELKQELLKKLSKKTKRNTILYFSSFLDKQSADAAINDKDMNALMENVYNLDRSKGLDLILHTPGGDLAATEQIIHYLHAAFDHEIRAIIPQMAMSAGAMIAVSCKSIMMGKQSCLGPFDPQFNGVPCQSAIREFDNAVEDVKKRPESLGLWQAIISRLNPTFLTLCDQASKLSEEVTEKILSANQFADAVKQKIKETFTDNSVSKIHNRHIDREQCKSVGLNIEDLEEDQDMQDLILGIHHCCMILSENCTVVKIVENNIGGGYLCNHLIPITEQS
ncbi:MAG: hypothetical protein J1E79_04020 [Rikenella sp.]|nr:hypothetical protein [Rikenella sp.]